VTCKCETFTNNCTNCGEGSYTERLERERDEALRRVTELERDGSPGVLHEVDQAFYNLTVKQRDRLAARIGVLEDALREVNDYLTRDLSGMRGSGLQRRVSALAAKEGA
jgi:hypothetical protein